MKLPDLALSAANMGTQRIGVLITQQQMPVSYLPDKLKALAGTKTEGFYKQERGECNDPIR